MFVKKDQQMLQESANRLRWIVIDEAHSYSGSAAVELAYQIKRVLEAFGRTPEQVRLHVHLLRLVVTRVLSRFQTSSQRLQASPLNGLRLSVVSVWFVLWIRTNLPLNLKQIISLLLIMYCLSVTK